MTTWGAAGAVAGHCLCCASALALSVATLIAA